jgi:transposase-like protein
MVKTGPRKYYDKEFKIKAIQLVTERGRKAEEVA